MRIDWRIVAGLLVIVGAVLGTVLGISFVRESDAGATAQYEVTVRFNTSATQDDLFEAGALLGTYDDDLEFVIMESFPPIGRAVLATDAPDFCQTVETELAGKSYVSSVSCQPWQEPGQADPDTTVSTDNDAE
jgi:hypothetical protein